MSWRRWRHDLKATLIHGWPYVQNRALRRYPPRELVIETRRTGPFELHLLTSERDHMMALWSALSYYAMTGRDDPLVIHDDGSLSASHKRRLYRHFPYADILPRSEMDRRVCGVLRPTKLLTHLRSNYPILLKYIDFVISANTNTILMLDSDTIFFSQPVSLVQTALSMDPASSPHYFSKDYESNYAFQQHCPPGILPALINTGLAVVNVNRVDFRAGEDFLRDASIDLVRRGHYIEQTLWAFECLRSGFDYLPDEYAIAQGPGTNGVVSKHYVGPVRDYFYLEGIPFLRRFFANVRR